MTDNMCIKIEPDDVFIGDLYIEDGDVVRRKTENDGIDGNLFFVSNVPDIDGFVILERVVDI